MNKMIFFKYLILLLSLVNINSLLGQNIPVSITDSLSQDYVYYDFFHHKGVQLTNADSKTRKQLITITFSGKDIKKVEFRRKGDLRILQLTDTILRDGYKVFSSSSVHDGGKEYESIIFMSPENIFSFSFFKECPREAYMCALFNKDTIYSRISGYINTLNFQKVIDYFVNNIVDKDNCEYCNYLTHFETFAKAELAQLQKLNKSFLLWYNLAF